MRHQRRMNGIATAANKGAPANNSPKNGDGTPAFSYGGLSREGEKDVLNDSLWQACAGASVIVPRTGDLVYYFPQGHLEQVADFTRRDGQMELPASDLPYKILCRVMGVQLKAEANTDEVFAQITLIPESKQVSSDDEESRLKPRTNSRCFSKTLTLSDTGAHGGFSIPKKLAEECFPPLDMSQQPPGQELVAKDLHGVIWNFRHTYRGQPKRHLLTGGWSSFLHSKKLEPGDTCIFLCGENGELGIGIRRALKKHNKASSSTCVISGHSMQLGILATASYAVATGSMFTVYYRPWTCPSEFIVPLDHYMKSTKMKYSCGLRIQMQFEAEESTKRYAGTIIGIDDIDDMKWPGSEWRCLKVKWDGKLDIDMRPERVCPWNIEPLESSGKNIPNLPQPKRSRLLGPSMSGLCDFTKDGIDVNSANNASQRCERDLKGQDYRDIGFPQYDSQFRTKNQPHFQLRIPPCHSLAGSASFPDDDISISSHPKLPPTPTTYDACNNVPVTGYLPPSNVNSNDSESRSQGWRTSESRDENDNKIEYKLFGISLNHPELPSPQVAASSSTSTLHVPPMSQSSVSATVPVSKPSKGISGVTSQRKCKKCSSVSSRTCTKVLKRGSALGRSIDLSHITGYDDLISELDLMFDFKGSLIDGSSGWHVVPMDDDGDMMLFGDFPWQDFLSMVQKMIICPKEDSNNRSAIASTADSTTL